MFSWNVKKNSDLKFKKLSESGCYKHWKINYIKKAKYF